MAHLDNTDHYRVYDGEDKPLKLEHADTALMCAIDCTAQRVFAFSYKNQAEIDISESLALKWLKGHPEVPAILPDFIKRHIPPEAIEQKRKQQLGRV